MDLTESLLRSDVQHLEENLRTLSNELIFIQKFMKIEFGEKYASFRKNQQIWAGPSNKSGGAKNHQCNCSYCKAGTAETAWPFSNSSSRTDGLATKRSMSQRQKDRGSSVKVKPPPTDGVEMSEEPTETDQPGQASPNKNSFFIEDGDCGNDQGQGAHDAINFVESEIILGDEDDGEFEVPSGSDVGSDDERDIKTSIQTKNRNSDDSGSEYDDSKSPKPKRKYTKSTEPNIQPRKRKRLSNEDRIKSFIKNLKNNRGKPRQPCWKYFEFNVETHLSKCLIGNCKAELKGGERTSPLTNHLKKHPEIYEEVMKEWEKIKAEKGWSQTSKHVDSD